MNLKDKFNSYYKHKYVKSMKDMLYYKAKRKVMSPLIYLGGAIIVYMAIKFIYYKQLNKSNITVLEQKIDYLTKLAEENNKLLKQLVKK
jgi:hypothetical protein